MIKKQAPCLLITILMLIFYNSFILGRQQIPDYVMAYLKKHEVDAELKKELDALLSQPEVYRALSQIYRETNISQAKKQLKQAGFIFTGIKTHIFKHKLFPHYIFKMGQCTGKKTEIKCANRIRMAELIRETAAELNYAIIVPEKQCYFPPQDLPDLLPQIIVVAEKIDLSGRDKELTPKQKEECKTIQQITKIVDLALTRRVNTMSRHGIVYIIDTEEVLKRVSYPN